MCIRDSVTSEHTTKPSAAGEVVPRNSCSTWTVCRQEDMQEGGTENKWPEKCQTKKGLEFERLKNKEQIVKKISESVDVGISDDKQQQTVMSSTDTTSTGKPVISADNCYCYTYLTLHNLHSIIFFKSLKSIHVTNARTNRLLWQSMVNSSQLCLTKQSTRHTILGFDELTVWRVDWHPLCLSSRHRSLDSNYSGTSLQTSGSLTRG